MQSFEKILGDGTNDSIAGAMVGRDATLGIIPADTRNIVAIHLGITGDITNSVALLRQGRRLEIDMGEPTSGIPVTGFWKVLH